MNNKKTDILSRLIHWCFLLVIFFIPLIIIPSLPLSFELPKSSFFRFFTLTIWLLIGIKTYFDKEISLPKLKKLPSLLFAGYLITAIIACAISIAPHLSFFGSYERQQGLLQTLFYITFFIGFLTFFKDKKEQLKQLVKVACISGVITSIIAIIYPWQIDEFLGRIGGTLGHPTNLATFLVILIPFLITEFFESHKKSEKIFWIASIAIMLLSLYLSGSRAGLLGLFAEIILFVAIFKKKFLLIPLFCMLIGVFVFSWRLSFNEESMRSINTRLVTWPKIIEMIIENPFFGTGQETFMESFKSHKPQEFLNLEDINAELDRAHNEPLDITATTGIFGLIFYISIILYALKWAFKKTSPIIIKTAGISILGLSITNLFGFPLTIHNTFFWLLLGIIFAHETTDFSLKINKKTAYLIFALISIITIYGTTIFATNPLLAEYEYGKGIFEASKSNTLAAIENFYTATKLNPFESEYSLKASEYSIIIGKYDDAKKFHKKASANLGKNFSNIIYLQALLQKSDKNYEESYTSFEKLIEKAQLTPKYTLSYAEALKEGNHLKESIKEYEKLLEMLPHWEKTGNIGSISDFEKKNFRTFFKNNPEFFDIINELIDLYKDTNQQEQAGKYQKIKALIIKDLETLTTGS